MRTRAGAEHFAELLAAFVEARRVQRYSLSAQHQALDVLPRLFTHLRERRIGDIRAVGQENLASFARALARSKTKAGREPSAWTIAAHLSAVRRFFAWLERRGAILRNPAADLPLPRVERLPRAVLSEAQARRLMSAPDPTEAVGRRDRAILELLYGTGIRRSECLGLDLTDVDLAGGTLFIRRGKGGKDRLLPIPHRAGLALDLYLRDARGRLGRRPSSALFLARGARRLSKAGLQARLRGYGERARLQGHVSPHLLRHTCATHLLQGGADIRHVQELLGHASLETTALYTRVAIEDLRKVMRRCHPRDRARRR